jgi:hypothetical protein
MSERPVRAGHRYKVHVDSFAPDGTLRAQDHTFPTLHCFFLSNS